MRSTALAELLRWVSKVEMARCNSCSVRSMNAPFVAMPGAPFVASLLLVVRPGAPSSFLFLVVR